MFYVKDKPSNPLLDSFNKSPIGIPCCTETVSDLQIHDVTIHDSRRGDPSHASMAVVAIGPDV